MWSDIFERFTKIEMKTFDFDILLGACLVLTYSQMIEIYSLTAAVDFVACNFNTGGIRDQ